MKRRRCVIRPRVLTRRTTVMALLVTYLPMFLPQPASPSGGTTTGAPAPAAA